MAHYTAKAFREDGWWAAQLKEQPNILTQTRHLDQIPDMVRDALRLFPEIEPDPDNAAISVIVSSDVESQMAEARECVR
ncbi:hypothetical protein ACFLIN_05340 [Corynebacterium kutscheri]|uniref:hypothetical protein n=1 Tax=Corynebacterium kutscheri TaxID=35755 RepID=UPI0037BE8BC9